MIVDSFKVSYDNNMKAHKFDDLPTFKELSGPFQFPCECVKCESHSCKKSACPSFDKCTRHKKNESLKGVDVVLHDDAELFLIEFKDYRTVEIPPVEHIISEVAKKFRDSIYVIWIGSCCASNSDDQVFFDKIRRKQLSLSFIFHFESANPRYTSGLYAGNHVLAHSLIEKKLQSMLGPMKNFLRVINIETINNNSTSFKWKVEEKI